VFDSATVSSLKNVSSIPKTEYENSKEKFGTDKDFVSIDQIVKNLDFKSNSISGIEKEFMKFIEKKLPNLNKVKVSYELMEKKTRRMNFDAYPQVKIEIGKMTFPAIDVRGQDFKYIVRATGLKTATGILKMYEEHKLWAPNFCASIISDDSAFMADEAIGFVMAVDPNNIYLTSPSDIHSPTYNPGAPEKEADFSTYEFNAVYRKLTIVNAYIDQISRNADLGKARNDYVKMQRLIIVQEQSKLDLKGVALNSTDAKTLQNQISDIQKELIRLNEKYKHLIPEGRAGTFSDGLTMPEFELLALMDHYKNAEDVDEDQKKNEFQKLFGREGTDIVGELKKSLDLISGLLAETDRMSSEGESVSVFHCAFRPLTGPDEILDQTMRPAFADQHGRIAYNELNIHLEKEGERVNRPTEVKALLINQTTLDNCGNKPQVKQALVNAMTQAKAMGIPILFKS